MFVADPRTARLYSSESAIHRSALGWGRDRFDHKTLVVASTGDRMATDLVGYAV
jgi:hypothetical protein